MGGWVTGNTQTASCRSTAPSVLRLRQTTIWRAQLALCYRGPAGWLLCAPSSSPSNRSDKSLALPQATHAQTHICSVLYRVRAYLDSLKATVPVGVDTMRHIRVSLEVRRS